MASPDMMEAWGSDGSGEIDRPASLTNAAAIAAGDYHSTAVTESGTITQWGEYFDGALVSPPPYSNYVATAAGMDHDIGLLSDGKVVTWGCSSAYANYVPTNLPPVKAVACGSYHNVALLTNGSVVAWGVNAYAVTNVPSDLTNANAATAIAASYVHSLALRANGTVEAWGYNGDGETNVPAGLTNIVAIAAGGGHCLALQSNGKVVAWGANNAGQTNVPAGLSNVMAIAAGWEHSLALRNDGTLVAWGANSNGQANIPVNQAVTNIIGAPGMITNITPASIVKLIAAGGDHTLAAIWSRLVQYPVDVTKDLLLIYNTNSLDSSNVCAYYLANRPMVGRCSNVLGIGCTTGETILPGDYTNVFLMQITNWLASHPTIRPSYVILFQDIPSRVNPVTNTAAYFPDNNPSPSVQCQLNQWAAPNWHPFVSSINMNGTGGTNDCIAYINKLTNIGNTYSPGKLIISANVGGYSNLDWYFDDTSPLTSITYGSPTYPTFFYPAVAAVTNTNPNASVTYLDVTSALAGTLAGHITNASNVTAFGSWGVHGYNGNTNAGYATNGTVQFTGQSGWYLIETGESFNGMRYVSSTGQGNFIQWFSATAFGGNNYSSTPVGSVCNVDEPYVLGLNEPDVYFGDWAAGRILAYCAWHSFPNYTRYLQVIGDPFTKQ